MMSTKYDYWKYCSNRKIDNRGLTLINLSRDKDYMLRNKKQTAYNHYINFCKSENDVKKKFKIFKPISIGYYDSSLESTKLSEHHFTFFGKKR